MIQRKQWLVVLLLLASGCAKRFETKSILSEPRMSGSSVVLDLFFVRLPYGDPRLNGEIWQEIDEQALPPLVRQRLAQHGFQAGTCGTHPPAALENLLNEHATTVAPNEKRVSEWTVEPFVRRRHLQLPAGRPAEIITSELYESLPLLEALADGQVGGQTFYQAQGVFTLTAYPQSDGRARICLRPEIQHGEPHQQFSQRDTHLVLESRRPRKLFEKLDIEANLAAGEMLVITSAAKRPGSAGHYFFTHDASDGLIQKLLIVRLSQTQRDAALASELPAVDETQEWAAATPVAGSVPHARH